MTNRQARAFAAARKYIAASKDNIDEYARRGEVASLTSADFFKRFGAKVPEGKDVFGSVARRAHQADKDHVERNTPVRSAFSAGTSTSRLNLRRNT